MSKKDDLALVPKYRFPEFVDSWGIKPFKKYVKLYRGSSPRPIKDYITKNEGINWIKISDASNSNNFYITNVAEQITEEGAKKSRLVEKGELILANSMSFGATYEVGVSGCIYDGWFVLREYEDNFIKKFLLQQLNTYEQQKQYSRLSAGGVVKNISSDIVYETILKRPSKEEQQKIADCLFSIDDLISAEEKKLALLQNYKKGWMQKLFPAEGKTVPEWRFPEFKDSEGWETIKLRELADYRRGSFPQPYGLPKWYDELSGMPFIQVFDVDENMCLKATTKNKISELASQQSVFIEKGTLIVTLQGSIGRVAITQYDAYIDRTLLLFEKFYRDVDKVFLAHTIQQLFEIKKQSAPGGIIKTITKQVLSEFTVQLPEKPEQQKIANFLSGIDDLISKQTGKIEALKHHKKALMQGLFPTVEEILK